MPIARSSLAALMLAAGCALVAPPPKVVEVPAAAPAKAAPRDATPLPTTAAPATSAPVANPPAPVAAKPPAPVAAKPPAPIAAKPAAPPLDLRSLEERLKDTAAIGMLTKLSLKNQVDDLIARFKAFHDGQRPPTLTELRPAYELLLMKVLSLLQDHDTKLANDINASRDAIWGVLTDRQKLAQFI
ncbi:MAG: hypothetical protein ACXWF2_15420 [Usitatibacter sp.]